MMDSVLAAGLAALVVTLLYTAIPWLTPPLARRAYVLGFVATSVAGICLWHALFALITTKESFQRRVVVIGSDPTSRRVAARLGPDAGRGLLGSSGYRVVGFREDMSPPSDGQIDPAHGLMRWIVGLDADEVIVADGVHLPRHVQDALLDCRELGLRVTPLSVAYERLVSRLPVEHAQRDLVLIVTSTDNPVGRLYVVSKRAMDIGFTAIGLLVVAALSPIVAAGNRLFSPGPLFSRRQCVGRGGRPFAAVRFRTERMPAARHSQPTATKASSGHSRVGAVLRRLHIDHLPEFWNVLKGQMSVVGPRPESPEIVGRVSSQYPVYRIRHEMRPGITGWSQIRSAFAYSMDEARVELECDLYYIKHASLFLDCLILLKTVPVMFARQGT